MFQDNSKLQVENIEYKNTSKEVTFKYEKLKAKKENNKQEEEYKLLTHKYSDIKSERDAIAKTRDQKESYIKMLLDEKQLL